MVCWLVAATLLDGADPARRVNIMAMPVLAAALMTIYDLGSDSVNGAVADVVLMLCPSSQCICWPPLTLSASPVMLAARSLAR
jgi:hypothetical protein